MGKIKTLDEIIEISKKHREAGETVGLVTGCFDLLHLGHMMLFQEAKKAVDFLIVGLDSDETIKINKGPERPIITWEHRIAVIRHIEHVDYILYNKDIYEYEDKAADKSWENIIVEINPTHLITNKNADIFWQKKELLI